MFQNLVISQKYKNLDTTRTKYYFSFVAEVTSKHLHPCFVKPLIKYPLVGIKGPKFRDMTFGQNLYHGNVDSKICILSNVKI